jgi:hypothetical protein
MIGGHVLRRGHRDPHEAQVGLVWRGGQKTLGDLSFGRQVVSKHFAEFGQRQGADFREPDKDGIERPK